jgi:hypothetical protein
MDTPTPLRETPPTPPHELVQDRPERLSRLFRLTCSPAHLGLSLRWNDPPRMDLPSSVD